MMVVLVGTEYHRQLCLNPCQTIFGPLHWERYIVLGLIVKFFLFIGSKMIRDVYIESVCSNVDPLT